MMFSLVALSLVVLCAADPEIKQKIQSEQPLVHEQQKQTDDVNVIPMYKQPYYPYAPNVYQDYPSSFRNFYSYMMQKYGNYPLRPYYQNLMPYPSRNNYYLRYSNKFQPNVYYDSQDIYDYQNVYDQDYVRPVTDISSYNQQYRKYADVDSEYLPYSPYYNPYSQKYHLVNKYYGKNLDLETDWPKINKLYGNLWDLENVRRYAGKNLGQEIDIPLNNYNLDWKEKPSYYPVGSGNHQTGISRNWYPSKELDVTYNQGISNLYPSKEWDVAYYHGYPQVSKYLGGSMKAPLDLENVKPSPIRIPLEKPETDSVRRFIVRNIDQDHIYE